MSRLDKISGVDHPERNCDVVFVHGARTGSVKSWQARGAGPNESFPHWLGQDLQWVGVWSFEFQSGFFITQAQRMPLVDQALSLLANLEVNGFGHRPIVFIAHSVGGLVVKQLLACAKASNEPQWTNILKQTKGVVFLATPHLGFWIPRLGRLIGLQKSALELSKRNPELRKLNDVFRGLVRQLGIRVKIYFEGKRSFYGLTYRTQVKKASADPRIMSAAPRAVEKTHNAICKPDSRDETVYKGTLAMVRACLSSRPIIFICYGHEDLRWRDRLVAALEARNTAERFEIWYDEIGIEVGHDWHRAISARLEAASIAILLISKDFLNSKYIRDHELPSMLSRRANQEIEVLPVVIEPCDWEQQEWLTRIQIYRDGRPLAEDDLDEIVNQVTAKFDT